MVWLLLCYSLNSYYPIAKDFLEYRILSIPVDKKVSVMTVWKLDSNEKSPLDVNLIVWGEAAMTHVWWPPFGSLFDFRKHNGDKAPEESWKLIHKTYPSKTQVPKQWRRLWVWVHFKSSFIHTMPVCVWKNSTFNLLNAFSIPIYKSGPDLDIILCIRLGLAIPYLLPSIDIHLSQ